MQNPINNPVVVKVESVNFTQPVTVGDERHYQDFSREVAWLREVIVELCLEHRGAPVKDMATYSDTREFFSVMDSVRQDIPGFMASYRIQPDDALKLVAYLTIKDVMYLPTKDNARNGKGFEPVNFYWYRKVERSQAEDASEAEKNGLSLSKEDVLIQRMPIWNSGEPIENLALLKTQYRDVYSPPHD